MKKVLYYMWKDKTHAKITYDYEAGTVELENYVSNPLLLPFGINTNPTIKEFDEFIESRCLPRTRYDLKHVLDTIDIPYYDPWLIVKYNHGLQFSDYGWLRFGEEDTTQYDDIKIRD